MFCFYSFCNVNVYFKLVLDFLKADVLSKPLVAEEQLFYMTFGSYFLIIKVAFLVAKNIFSLLVFVFLLKLQF